MIELWVCFFIFLLIDVFVGTRKPSPIQNLWRPAMFTCKCLIIVNSSLAYITLQQEPNIILGTQQALQNLLSYCHKSVNWPWFWGKKKKVEVIIHDSKAARILLSEDGLLPISFFFLTLRHGLSCPCSLNLNLESLQQSH